MISPPQFKDITGQRFERLVVRERAGANARYLATWLCQCDCGKQIVVLGAHLRNGNTRSCGCLQRDAVNRMNFVHGQKQTGKVTGAWWTWWGMIERCRNPKSIGYKYYGARGIKVCKRWREFSNFFADMGERPAGLTLDRINNDGDYEPSNCRWATSQQQLSNRRAARLKRKP